jgi:hypothetical protein
MEAATPSVIIHDLNNMKPSSKSVMTMSDTKIHYVILILEDPSQYIQSDQLCYFVHAQTSIAYLLMDTLKVTIPKHGAKLSH